MRHRTTCRRRFGAPVLDNGSVIGALAQLDVRKRWR
jgi:hypothetical protein